MKKTKRTFWVIAFVWFVIFTVVTNLALSLSFSYRVHILKRNARLFWQQTQRNLLQQSLNWLEPTFSLPPAEAESRIIEWIQTGKTELTGYYGLFREQVLVYESNERWHVLYHGLPVQDFYPSIEATPDPTWLAFINEFHKEHDGSLVLQWLPVDEEMIMSWTSFTVGGTPYRLLFSTPVENIYLWSRIGNVIQWRTFSFILANGLLMIWICIFTWLFHHQDKRRLQIKKEAENQLTLVRQYQQSLKTLQKELDSVNQNASSKDEFLMNMSHELRSPLNTILGMTDALEEAGFGTLPPSEDRKLGIIHESGLHLLSVFNDILDLAKVESGKMELEKTTFSIRSLCESCVRIIQPTAEKKHLSVSMNIHPELKGMTADETRVRQVLLNLLNNAVKFGKNGTPIHLEVSANPAHSVIRYQIVNQGDRIPFEKTSDVFQPFVQLNNALTRRYQGTGLGLVLALKLTMAHQGSIAVVSDEDETSFEVSLPMSALPAIEAPIEHQQLLVYTENRFYEEWLRDQDMPNCFITRKTDYLRGDDLRPYTHLFLILPLLLDHHLPLIADLSRQLEKPYQRLTVVLSVWHPRWEHDLILAGCDDAVIQPFDLNEYLKNNPTAKEE